MIHRLVADGMAQFQVAGNCGVGRSRVSRGGGVLEAGSRCAVAEHNDGERPDAARLLWMVAAG